MRCDCCNVLLTPQESVRRFSDTNAFTDTCTSCLKHIDRPIKEGKAFKEEEQLADDVENYDEDGFGF